MAARRGRIVLLAISATLAVGASGCGGQGESQPTEEPSIAGKLSVIDGGASASDFQVMLDCLVASGAPGTETDQKVADTLVASWEQSSKQDSLYAFSQAAASLYGC